MAGYYLLIDAGNTRIKWARVEENLLMPGVPVSIRPAVLPGIKAAWDSLEKPLGIALSNVAGERVEADITSFIERRWSMDPLVAKAQHHGFGVTSGYRDPERLGVDRWLALIAARDRSKQPTVIVDAGSACTIDLLDSEGRHLGGYILPGLTAMGEALVRGTHQIQESKAVGKFCLDPGLDTSEGMASGALLALVGAIERVFYDLGDRGSCEPLLIMTGGDAEKLGSSLRCPSYIGPELVLEGLWVNLKSSLELNSSDPPDFFHRGN
jgi:type III pantothenate kinase